MKHDLIGERCTIDDTDFADCPGGLVIRWGRDSTIFVFHDDGTLVEWDVSYLRFPRRTEQPDELRKAAEEVVRLMDEGVEPVDAMTRLRKALDL